MDRIFIEGQVLDSSEIFSTVVSYLIDDIRDFGAKNCNVSKTIILPGSKRNNIIFGGIYEITSFNNYDPTKPNVNTNFNAAVKAQCHIFRDGLQAIKGAAQLLAINIVDGIIEYELAITGELGGFVAAVGAAKLTGNTNKAQDLDFSAYSQTYSIANIQASKANVGSGSGIVYPLMDRGTYSIIKHDWRYGTFRPALFVKEYIDKIFAAAGYTYDCPLFNTARFKGLVVPQNTKILVNRQTLELALVIPSGGTFVATSGTTYSQALSFSTVALGSFTANSDNTVFTYSGADLIGVLHLFAIVTSTTACSPPFQINIVVNSSVVGIINLPCTTSYPYNINQDIPISITNTDTLSIVLYFGAGGAATIVLNTINVKVNSNSIKSVPVSLGEFMNPNGCIPQNILQIDFFSDIVKLFNLLVYEDPTKDKHLRIAPFSSDGITDGFYHLSGADNWANYIDRSSAIKIKPLAELNARFYEFNYKDDSDFHNDLYKKRYNLSYGSFKYDSNYQFSKDSHKINIGFSGTPIIGYNGEDKVYSTILKRTGPDTAPVEETTDCNIRILQTKVITGVASWNILSADGTATLGTYTDYLYAGHFDNPDAPANDIGYGTPKELFYKLLSGALNVNQFNVYWSSYIAEITDKDARMVTAMFKLPLKEISQLDFSKYKYIDGVLYRLNKIIDYNVSKEEKCSVELIKVTNKVY